MDVKKHWTKIELFCVLVKTGFLSKHTVKNSDMIVFECFVKYAVVISRLKIRQQEFTLLSCERNHLREPAVCVKRKTYRWFSFPFADHSVSLKYHSVTQDYENTI